MTQDEIIKMLRNSGAIVTPIGFVTEPPTLTVVDVMERFAKLVAEHERTKLQGQIETLHAMYELASKQRDYLMEQQNAQVAAMKGAMQ
jgi:hypothetical protein